ncbi:MAG TPA: hypothetical protein VNO70_09020 [Blastocatellia bacterium]|nr:hypothetical protein [Blastocatellia bacterium]
MQKPGLLTDEVVISRAQFISAVEQAMDGMERDYATARLSALLSDLWNLLERKAHRLPRRQNHHATGV